jgi:prevent-host-death family protein
MSQYSLTFAKAHLPSLIEAAHKGEDIVISRYGVPIARLSAIKPPAKRNLGFYPIDFKSNLLEATDTETLEGFAIQNGTK